MGGLEGGRLDLRPSGDAIHFGELKQPNWKVKHDEAEEHTQNNLEGTDETSAVPEGLQRGSCSNSSVKQSAVIF